MQTPYALFFSRNVLGISFINSQTVSVENIRESQVNSSLQWSLDNDTIDTFCIAGWHVLFTPTIYSPTDSRGKGASERLGEGD